MSETKKRFEQLSGGKIVEGYGLSEAPVVTHCNPLIGMNKIGSIGMPMPDVECRIVDPDNGESDVPPGESGELVLRGPQLMTGYHNMPAETASALRSLADDKRWLFTGDIVRMDQDGYFYVVDRKKELIKPGGFQVWPREVEEALASHPAVLEVGVAGIPDPQRGEAVKAWIVLRPGERATAEELKDWCTDRLARYKIPTEIVFRSQLPKSNVGKVLRRELQREHRGS
jgi:long-chain acyl-CoA synthetase